ncbi:MAG: hypothetical protein ABI691_21300 [Ginsengibacter sp.]
MIFGLSSNELIGYSGTIIASIWAARQTFLKSKHEKQKIKYLTYNKISENINLFSKNIELLKSSYDIMQLKSIEQKQKKFREQFDKKKGKWEEGFLMAKNYHQELDDKLELIRNGINNKTFDNDTLEQVKSGLELEMIGLSDMNNSLSKTKNEIDEVFNKIDEISDINLFEETISQKIYSFLDQVKKFIIDFNDISDLQIISSKKVIAQIKEVKKNASKLQSFLEKSILANETSPPVSTIFMSVEMIQQQTQNDKLLALMHKEMQ